MCKNGTNRENPVFYIGLSSDYMAFFAVSIGLVAAVQVAIGMTYGELSIFWKDTEMITQVQNHRELSSLWPEEGLC